MAPIQNFIVIKFIFVGSAQAKMYPYGFGFPAVQYSCNFVPYLAFNPFCSLPYNESTQLKPQQIVKLEQPSTKNMLGNDDRGAVAPARAVKQAKLGGASRKGGEEEEEKGGTQKYNDFNKNVLPNNIHLVLSYIRRINKSGRVVTSILEKFPNERGVYSQKKFFSYQAYMKERMGNIRYNDILEGILSHFDPCSTVFSPQEQMFYNKVTRILILHFLREGALLNVLSSTKITRTKKDEHLKIQRMLMEKIRDLG